MTSSRFPSTLGSPRPPAAGHGVAAFAQSPWNRGVIPGPRPQPRHDPEIGVAIPMLYNMLRVHQVPSHKCISFFLPGEPVQPRHRRRWLPAHQREQCVAAAGRLGDGHAAGVAQSAGRHARAPLPGRIHQGGAQGARAPALDPGRSSTCDFAVLTGGVVHMVWLVRRRGPAGTCHVQRVHREYAATALDRTSLMLQLSWLELLLARSSAGVMCS
jgi:hypothetical protein